MRKLKYSHNEEVSYKSLQLRTNKGAESLFRWRNGDCCYDKDDLLFPHGALQIGDWGYFKKFETTKYYYLKPCEENDEKS